MSEYRNEKHVSLDSISSVSIINPIGRIEVIGWDEPDLLIEATVKCDSEKPGGDDHMPLIKQVDDTLVIRVHEPGKNTIKDDLLSELDVKLSPNELGNNDFGLQEFVGNIVKMATTSFSKLNLGMKTSLIIHLPRTKDLNVKNLNGVITISDMNCKLKAKGVNGPISLTNIKGQVTASAVNGPVSLEKSSCETITLKSVNGPVKCYLDSVSGDIVLKSVNGPVRLTVPDNADIDLCAKTMHGNIKVSSSFKQNVRSNHKVQSSLNNGGNNITLKTSTGAITVMTSEHSSASASVSTHAPASTSAPTASPASVPTSTSPSNSNEKPQPEPANTQTVTNKQTETPDSPSEIISRMLDSGKISPQEAEKLRNSL